MSLIADALKKAQSAKLGRRYLAPNPSGMLSGVGGSRRDGGRASFGSISRRINFSPTFLVGLGSGIFFFIVLFTYFFYGGGLRTGPSIAVSSAARGRPAGLILAPAPPVPAVEPLALKKEGAMAEGLKGQGTTEKAPPLEKARKDPGIVKSESPKIERKPSEQAKGSKPHKRSGSSTVAVTHDLSEEVRYHFNLAFFYQQEGKFSLARGAYEKVVQMWPLYAEAHNNLGVVYKELGLYEQANAELKKALALDPRYARAYHNLGVVYQIKRDWKEATKNYERALSLDRNLLSSYNNLGLIYRSQKRPHEARVVLDKALAINPSYPQTHYNLALVLEEIGELARAQFHFQKFIELSRDGNSSLIERVRVHLQGLVVKK